MEISGNTDNDLILQAQEVAETQGVHVHMDILPQMGGKPRAKLYLGSKGGPDVHVMKHTQSHYNFKEGQWYEM